MQNYSNYRIVFIDDFSDDDTFEKSLQYLQKKGFPKERLHLFKNKKRLFATYNIINSAYNFCGENVLRKYLKHIKLLTRF
jgi:glycosyltransferase involved in cell wall biosynthesis